MILSISHAPMGEANREHLFGAWSNLMVGEKPDGLVDCYLVEGDGVVQVVSVWKSDQHHDRALASERGHPALLIFDACGLDPTHVVLNVMGRLTQ